MKIIYFIGIVLCIYLVISIVVKRNNRNEYFTACNELAGKHLVDGTSSYAEYQKEKAQCLEFTNDIYGK